MSSSNKRKDSETIHLTPELLHANPKELKESPPLHKNHQGKTLFNISEHHDL